jgi:hypothetical protein
MNDAMNKRINGFLDEWIGADSRTTHPFIHSSINPFTHPLSHPSTRT